MIYFTCSISNSFTCSISNSFKIHFKCHTMSYSCVILVFAGILMLGQAAPPVYVQDGKPTTIKGNFDKFADAIRKWCINRSRPNEPCEAPSTTPEQERLYNDIADVAITFLDGLFGRKPAASIQNHQLLSRPYPQNAASASSPTPAPTPATTPAPTPLGLLTRALADFIQTSKNLRSRPGGRLAELESLLDREMSGWQNYRK